MNILLLQLKRIGDLILTTPVIAAVREKYPAAKISLVVAHGTRELLPAIRGIDETFVARGNVRDAGKWFRVARRRYEYCIDFTLSDRSAFIAALSRARKRIAPDHARSRAKLRAMSYNELVKASLRLLHTVDYNLSLLAPLGIRGASPQLVLDLPTLAFARAEQLLTESGVRGNFLILHPGSARIEKFWEAERWAALIDFAAERQLHCVITGAPSALEQTHIEHIKAAARAPFVNLSGKADLVTLAALIKRARLLVTVDSAPVHLAAAMQTPQVALFGPTNPLHWRPRFTPAIVLQAGNPAPLTEFSADQQGVPMNQISTAQVIDGMEALLAARRATSE